MKKIWEEYRPFLVTLIIVSSITLVFMKLAVPEWLQDLTLLGAGFFLGARTATDKIK